MIFRLDNLNLKLPHGILVGVVGNLGSGINSKSHINLEWLNLQTYKHFQQLFNFIYVGKSSLLSSMIGEMPRTSGSITLR